MSKTNYLSYNKAKNFIKELRLKTKKDWQRYIDGTFKNLKKPANIPNNPDIYYKDYGWQSWSSWFSANLIPKKMNNRY